MLGVPKGKMPRRGDVEKGIRRIPDSHHPRGYREVCETEAAWDRRRKERGELAGFKCECRFPHGCGGHAPFGDAHHVQERGMGAAYRDDHLDNLRWVLRAHHSQIHVGAKVVPRKG